MIKTNYFFCIIFSNTVAPKVTLHQLEIESKPLNQLKGKTLHGSTSMSVYSIRGSDLHLRCNITANPSADQVVWYRNSYKLTVDDSNLGKSHSYHFYFIFPSLGYLFCYIVVMVHYFCLLLFLVSSIH